MGTLLIPTKNLRRYERRIGAVFKHSVYAERYLPMTVFRHKDICCQPVLQVSAGDTFRKKGECPFFSDA
jgi:hypothetical protein